MEIKILGKTHCPLCGEKLDPYATYPWNREGSFDCFWHCVCIEKVAKWFRKEGYKVDWKTLEIINKLNGGKNETKTT